jgi:hypothetical protein
MGIAGYGNLPLTGVGRLVAFALRLVGIALRSGWDRLGC